MLSGGDIGGGQDLEQDLIVVCRLIHLGLGQLNCSGDLQALVADATGEVLDGHIAYHLALVGDCESVAGVDLSHQAGPGSFVDIGQVPVFVVDLEDPLSQLERGDDQEALLGLGYAQDLRGKVGCFVHVVKVDLHAESAGGAHLRGGAGEAAAAQVLEADLYSLCSN